MYRINPEMVIIERGEYGHMLRQLEEAEVLIHVEPCEHGNYDGHFTEYNPLKDRKLDGHWCRGAALGCNCEACSSGPPHRSDCAVHNEPAFPNGPCDCGAESFVALLVPANEKKSNER